MLSLPFMKIPILLLGNPEDPAAEEKEVEAYIQPEAVETFYPAYYFGSMIVMKSGDKHMTRLKTDQLEAAFAGYWQHCSKVLTKSTEPAPIIVL